MKGLVTGLLANAALWILKGYRKASIEWVRIEAALYYVRGVAGARKAFVGGVLLAGCLLLAGAGFILLHIGLYALLPSPANAVTLLVLGAIYLATALTGLWWACSEKTWMKYTNASRYVALATKRDRR